MAGSSLRSFIKDVRSAKTVAEERAIITKASAKIRTKLRDDHLPQEKRRNNIQKLLYLYVLGRKHILAKLSVSISSRLMISLTSVWVI